jgi:hypothetical protein
MEFRERTLPEMTAIRFFKAVRDEDSFTIFWELAEHSPKPVPFESIRRTFGASPQYLMDVLYRLHHLGIATKVGRQWTVTHWAKSSLENLEEIMKDVQVEVAQPVSPIMGVYGSDALAVGTLDGFWTASTSQVTAQSRSGGGESPTASANQTVELNPSELTEKPQNEARSHDYK